MAVSSGHGGYLRPCRMAGAESALDRVCRGHLRDHLHVPDARLSSMGVRCRLGRRHLLRPVSLAGHAPSCPRHAAAGVVDRAAPQSRGNIWLLCALMVLWANVHGSFILGIAIAAGIGYVSMAILAAALACINPYGYLLYETVWFQISYMDVMRQQIHELRPVNAYDDMVQVIGLLVAAAVALWRGTKLGFRRAFTLCTILFFGLQNRRGLAFFGVTAPLIVAYSPRFSGSVSIPGRSALSDLISRFNVHSTTE